MERWFPTATRTRPCNGQRKADNGKLFNIQNVSLTSSNPTIQTSRIENIDT